MTNFVIDRGVAQQLAGEGVAPTLLRSQTLSALHEAVHASEIAPDAAFDREYVALTQLQGDAFVTGDARDTANGLVCAAAAKAPCA